MKTLDEQIAIMTAYKNGARVERRPSGTVYWLHCDAPSWDWENYDYRIAHEPIVISVMIRRYSDGRMQGNVSMIYNADEVRRRIAVVENVNLTFREVTDGS